MFCRSARMPYPPMYKLPLIHAQINSGIYLSSTRYTLAMARIVASKCSGLVLAFAVLSKRDMLGGSRHYDIAGLEICRRCSSPKGEMLKTWGCRGGMLWFFGSRKHCHPIWFLLLSTREMDVQIELGPR